MCNFCPNNTGKQGEATPLLCDSPQFTTAGLVSGRDQCTTELYSSNTCMCQGAAPPSFLWKLEFLLFFSPECCLHLKQTESCITPFSCVNWNFVILPFQNVACIWNEIESCITCKIISYKCGWTFHAGINLLYVALVDTHVAELQPSHCKSEMFCAHHVYK